MAAFDSKKFFDFAQFADPANPKHRAAYDDLYAKIKALDPSLLTDEANWVRLYRTQAAKSPGDRVPKQALDLIKKYEGWREKPYICPAGVATIGYGCTFYPDGRKVSMSDPAITKEKGEEYLRVVTDKSFVSVLEKTIPNWSGLTDGQKSALISFAYNLGAHFYGDESNFGSITRDLRDKNYSNVPTTLLKYRNPGSAFEEGLRKRRAEEGTIWKS